MIDVVQIVPNMFSPRLAKDLRSLGLTIEQHEMGTLIFDQLKPKLIVCEGLSYMQEWIRAEFRKYSVQNWPEISPISKVNDTDSSKDGDYLYVHRENSGAEGHWTPRWLIVDRENYSIMYFNGSLTPELKIRTPQRSPQAELELRRIIRLILSQFGITLKDIPKVILVEANYRYNELLKRISMDLRDIYNLTPRQFEELVAEMLDRDGFDVHLTKASRDGGIDIFATKYERFGKVVYGYECKRLRPNTPVGVSIVRELVAAIQDNNCKLGVLCATSRFSSEAIALAQRSQIIYPQDISDMHRWIIDLARRF